MKQILGIDLENYANNNHEGDAQLHSEKKKNHAKIIECMEK